MEALNALSSRGDSESGMGGMVRNAPGPGKPHGIYVFEGGEWKMLRSEGDPLDVAEIGDGVAVVYFDNAQCPVCRMQDTYWLDVVKRFSGDKRVKFFVVLCDWFTQACNSTAAAETFKKYGVNASPTIIVAAVKGGRVVSMEYLEGLRDSGVISIYISSALKKLGST
jgi:hypothetical protein